MNPYNVQFVIYYPDGILHLDGVIHANNHDDACTTAEMHCNNLASTDDVEHADSVVSEAD